MGLHVCLKEIKEYTIPLDLRFYRFLVEYNPLCKVTLVDEDTGSGVGIH